MKIKNIRITNFKSIYGTQEFDFDELDGLIKLSGPVGSGKTTLGEAILYGLYGSVKGQTNPGLIAWNTKTCEVEIFMESKGREIHIVRNAREPLIVEINGKTLSASSKRDTQAILEEDLYDVPKLAIQKMCVISFNAFNSLASMSPAETKQFLDEIFGFKLFTEYNDEVVTERKTQQNESVRLNAIYADTIQQIQNLSLKKEQQKEELQNSIDIDGLTEQRRVLIEQGVALKTQDSEAESKCKEQEKKLNEEKLVFYNKKLEYGLLGKQIKEWVNKFGSGICPTCGQKINDSMITSKKDELQKYAKLYKEQEALENEKSAEIQKIKADYIAVHNKLVSEMNNLKTQIAAIDNEFKIYQNNIQLISENYDELIAEYQVKAEQIKSKIDTLDIEIAEWNEMTELFTHTLRYNLLETLIPHINNSIKYFINKLDQPYNIRYDQEFKPHILIDTYDKEIYYNNLSTGQRKSLDMAIIFGVLQNIIANVDFNVFFLDELFSNLDADLRNIMLSLLNESLSENRSIFVINHAEMNDDFFEHKIRVNIEQKKIISKSKEEVIVNSSKYTKIF